MSGSGNRGAETNKELEALAGWRGDCRDPLAKTLDGLDSAMAFVVFFPRARFFTAALGLAAGINIGADIPSSSEGNSIAITMITTLLT
jgi:hypothetical protein